MEYKPLIQKTTYFIKHDSEKYKVPIERLNTRISIRNLNKCIEYHSDERTKSKLTLDIIDFIVNRIPCYELKKYSRHCLPMTVMKGNRILYKRLISRGFSGINTWCLFQALKKGEEGMCRAILIEPDFNFDMTDIIPLIYAAYVGKVVSLKKLLNSMQIELGDCEASRAKIKELTDYDLYNNKTFDNRYTDRHQNDNRIKLMTIKMLEIVKDLLFDYKHDEGNTRAIKRCDCPSHELEHIQETVDVLINMSKEGPMNYAISQIDSLSQLIRAYGILKWGYLEHGGHDKIDFYCGE